MADPNDKTASILLKKNGRTYAVFLYDFAQFKRQKEDSGLYRAKINGKWHCPDGKYTALSADAVAALVRDWLSGKEPPAQRPEGLDRPARIFAHWEDDGDGPGCGTVWTKTPPHLGASRRWQNVLGNTFSRRSVLRILICPKMIRTNCETPFGASSGGGAPGLTSSREYAMRVALHDSDETNFPNLVLMKLAAWHKAQGDDVSWFVPDEKLRYDRVYSSKVFTFTPEQILPSGAIKGGTGYGLSLNLPDEIEHICPDYDIYKNRHVKFRGNKKFFEYSMGFLTRGCPNACPWCIVPKKEGDIRAHADIEEFCRHRHVILMDNNVLAHDHGIKQIEKISRLGLRVDFNQGLDARRIDFPIARRLAALGWRKPLRLACDRSEQIPVVEKAVRILRSAGVKPQRYFCYVLVTDVEEALERVKFLRSLGVDPFAQAYRSFSGTDIPTDKQRRFCRWVNHKALFKSISWEKYWEQERKKLEKRNRQSWLWLW